jgi:hypothetical protein
MPAPRKKSHFGAPTAAIRVRPVGVDSDFRPGARVHLARYLSSQPRPDLTVAVFLGLKRAAAALSAWATIVC